MCGLSGYISFTPHPASIIQAMTDVIAHRGPDDEGFVLFSDSGPIILGGKATSEPCYRSGYAFAPGYPIDGVNGGRFSLAFGHRRLAIVDASPAGHQPMCSPDGRYWIIYNGEVYNHIELRVELEKKGHKFFSNSDTEVILAAYETWGKECLSHFNGMFAFLIYDQKRKILFAARDRFGIKPLYYRVSAQGMAFGSEIKQFTVLPDWQAQMNGQRVYDFLNWGISDHTDETLFSGVFQLRGGEMAELDIGEALSGRFLPGNRIAVSQWYRLTPRPFTGTMQDASSEFRDRFVDAVRLHLRSDVPIGSCLSGGLDSSSIVCVMNRLLKKGGASPLQKTFSACSEVARFDEREFIDEVVRYTSVEAHYTYPALEDLFNSNEMITWHQDEPFGSTSIFAQWNVFSLAAKSGVKVMLDGQGADEQLAGYHSYFGLRLAHLMRTGQWLKFSKEMKAIRALHGHSPAWSIQQTLNNMLPEALRQPLRQLLRKPATLEPAWLDMKRLGAVEADPFLQYRGAKPGSVEAMSYAQLTKTNLQMLLHWEDRDSMAHSVESRVPFLDHRLVEFVLGLPEEYKISHGITKLILREGMKEILPEKIRMRMDKLGFVTPEEIWVRQRSPDSFRKALSDSVDLSRGILNEKACVFLEKTISGNIPFNFLPWRLISFGAWMKVFSIR